MTEPKPVRILMTSGKTDLFLGQDEDGQPGLYGPGDEFLWAMTVNEAPLLHGIARRLEQGLEKPPWWTQPVPEDRVSEALVRLTEWTDPEQVPANNSRVAEEIRVVLGWFARHTP